MATVVMPQSRSQSARASRSAVKVPKRRTGWGARSGGTATQCSASPISIPAAWGLESGSEEDGRSTKGSGTVGTGGQGSGNASFEGVIRPPEVNTHTAEHHGGRRDEATCSLPNGIRPKPVASDVVATSRDQPHKRAHSTSAGTVTTTHGVLVRIARNGGTGSVPLRCVAAQPPKPLTTAHSPRAPVYRYRFSTPGGSCLHALSSGDGCRGPPHALRLPSPTPFDRL